MVAVGKDVRSLDFPPSQTQTDDTALANLSNTAYATGTPEVGTYFVAPTSGRIRLTIGGGFRDNNGTDRVFLSPQIFLDNSSGTEFLAPTVDRGYGSDESSTEYQYASRVTLVEGLTPGKVYYARVMHAVSGSVPLDSADIAARDITTIAVP